MIDDGTADSAPAPGMDDTELQSLIRAKRSAAVNYMDTEFRRARIEAMKFYRGDALGDEEEGMSTVVSRDTMEAIEGTMPSLMRPFVSGDEIVRFEPRGPEDEEACKQASEYLNYIFFQRNDGFKIVYDTMKDGLMLRLGVAKVVWDDYADVGVESYKALTPQEFEMLMADTAVEVLGQPGIDEDGIFCRVKRKGNGKACVYAIPPDEFLFERQLAKLEDATYLAHRRRMMVADLIGMGFDKERVVNLPVGDTPDFDQERLVRFQQEQIIQQEQSNDPMSRVVWVTETFIKVDFDGDGWPEWRRVMSAGAGDEILLNEEVDDHPFAVWTPIPWPHKLVGLSLHDMTRDVQLMKTALQRELMNNLYLTNRPMREVVEGQVNIDDLLSPRVGGIVRVKQPGAMREVVTPNASAAAFQAIEYIDTVREQRTGVTRYNQGMDANSLNKTATGISAIMNASAQRMELVARQYAEFLRDVMKKLLAVVQKNAPEADVIKLRGQWVPMNPREWSDQFDCTVSVGLGTGDKQQKAAMLMQVLQVQREVLAGQAQGAFGGQTLVTPENLFNTLKRLVEFNDLKGVEAYFTDPAGQEQAPQQGPDPAQMQQMQAQAEQQAEAAKMAAEADTKIRLAAINAASAERIARQNNIVKLMLAGLSEAQAEAALDADGDGMGVDGTEAHEGAETPAYEAAEAYQPGEGAMSPADDDYAINYGMPPQGLPVPEEPPEGFEPGVM